HLHTQSTGKGRTAAGGWQDLRFAEEISFRQGGPFTRGSGEVVQRGQSQFRDRLPGRDEPVGDETPQRQVRRTTRQGLGHAECRWTSSSLSQIGLEKGNGCRNGPEGKRVLFAAARPGNESAGDVCLRNVRRPAWRSSIPRIHQESDSWLCHDSLQAG